MTKTRFYDERYGKSDMLKKPFGYNADYYLWRAAKTKGEFAKCIGKNDKILDVAGGMGTMVRFLLIYYAFGFKGDKGEFYSSLYCYDTSTDSWLVGTPSLYKRDGVACGVINGKLYTVGGRNLPSPNPNELSYNVEYVPSRDRLVKIDGKE